MQGLRRLPRNGEQASRSQSRYGAGGTSLPRAQSLHPTARMLKVSHRTVLHCLKKAQQLPNFKSTLLRGQADDRLKVDEIFTFVGMKIRQIRVWIVPCHRSRQILSFFIGDGSVESCKRLWRKLPYEYLRCFWRAYRCLPTRTHFLVGKENRPNQHYGAPQPYVAATCKPPVAKSTFFLEKGVVSNVG